MSQCAWSARRGLVQPVEHAASAPAPRGPAEPTAGSNRSTPASGSAVESRAAELLDILGEIREASRAQRQSAKELQEQRRSLAVRETALRLKRSEAQEELVQRVHAETEKRRQVSSEAESLCRQLREEKRQSQADLQAAEQVRQGLERRLRERAEEHDRALRHAESRDRHQEAAIRSLQHDLARARGGTSSLADSAASEPQKAESPPNPPESPALGSPPNPSPPARRALFTSFALMNAGGGESGLPGRATPEVGEVAKWLFDASLETAPAQPSPLASEPARSPDSELGAAALFLRGLASPESDRGEAPRPRQSPAGPAATPSPGAGGATPRGLAAAAERADVEATPPTPEDETPQRGCVARKVSMFEQKGTAPAQRPKLSPPPLEHPKPQPPPALRSGPSGAPVATPLGSLRGARRWREEAQPFQLSPESKLGAVPLMLPEGAVPRRSP